MTLRTCLQFLIGKRQAIFDIAATRSTVWLGLLFVISAGFAREYDGESLLYEPWHLALPLVASLATSFVLFCMLWLASDKKDSPAKPFLQTYRTFLGVYWMTAPLAWLYAIPFERFLSAGDATRANLWLLGIVALWRVVLMTRVAAVLFDGKARQAFPIVMLFSDTVALVLLYLTPLPVISIMGGIRLTESERLIQDTTLLIGFFGTLSWPIWLLSALFVTFKKRLSWKLFAVVEGDQQASRVVWTLGIVSLLIWIPLLFVTQPEQQRRYDVERDLRSGKIARAIATLSNHEQSDFPPHWDPPPRIGYGENKPEVLDVLKVIISDDSTKPWVSEVYFEKLNQSLGHFHGLSLEGEKLELFLDVVESQPDNSTFVEEHQHTLKRLIDEDSTHSQEVQGRARTLLEQLPDYEPEPE